MTERATQSETPQPPVTRQQALEDAVRRASAGFEGAGGFRSLEAQLAPRLLHYFRGRSFSTADAEDLVQCVLTRVWQGLPSLQQQEKFLPWLFTIARNVARSAHVRQRKERRWLAGGAELAEAVPDPRSDGSFRERVKAERLALIHAAIDALPAQQRQCLLLRVREELSYEEISAVLRLSLNTVRNHLAAAKKNLRHRLEPELQERR